MNSFEKVRYSFRHAIKSWGVGLQTSRFEKEIRKAYGVSSTPRVSALALPGIAAEHPGKTVLLLAAISLSIASPLFLPDFIRISRSFVATIRESKSLPQPVARLQPLSQPEKKAPSGPFFNALVADKQKKVVMVYKCFKNGDPLLLKSFPIAIGENWGRKEKRGDLKTPEGFYWLVNVLEDRELPPIYGIRAFVTDYPNEADRLEKRTGQGIWVHGCEKGKQPDKTKGCLALSNEHLAELSPYIGAGTPLIIAESADAAADTLRKYFEWNLAFGRHQELAERFRFRATVADQFLEEWREAWESRDMDRYAALYSDQFSQKGMSFEEWKNYKREIFSRPQPIEVGVRQVEVVKADANEALVRFYQDYSSGEYVSQSEKFLKLAKTEGVWKIVEESAI